MYVKSFLYLYLVSVSVLTYKTRKLELKITRLAVSNLSVIAKRIENAGHLINKDQVGVLDIKRDYHNYLYYHNRLIMIYDSEMINIKKQSKDLNIVHNTEMLNCQYLPFLGRLYL